MSIKAPDEFVKTELLIASFIQFLFVELKLKGEIDEPWALVFVPAYYAIAVLLFKERD